MTLVFWRCEAGDRLECRHQFLVCFGRGAGA
jgi:hypothetical protein